MTRKAIPVFYEGTKMVRISDLPETQSTLFSGWVNPSHFVILGGVPDFDCVKYEDYEFWYQNYFVAQRDLDEMI